MRRSSSGGRRDSTSPDPGDVASTVDSRLKIVSKTQAATRPQLSDEQLGELLSLIDGADSVELKLTVPESDQRSAVGALDMDPLECEIRQVFFFDTPDLALYDAGVVARARRVQKKGDDSVVKLRPIVPSELPSDLRQSPN